MNNQRIVVSLNLKRTIKIMKLTILMLVACLSQIAAATYAQTTKLSISVNNETLENVLKQIEKQSEFLFFYNLEEVNKNERISITKKNSSIQGILDVITEKTGLKYTVKDRHIVLTVQNNPTSALASQQVRKITGTVSDAFAPIAGVNIVEKGTTNGTTTDMDGNFSIEVSDGAILQISFIGYITQDIAVKNQRVINVMLKEDTQALEEVVVIGYGTVKKKDLTGSVGAIKGEDLAARKTTQLSTALQGAVSGVMVSRNNGTAPGEAASSIRVRGVTTIGDSNPLVIIDGVPGNINDVNPNDVENMTVLKDAASSSIYGSRAASGVILITTKRAKENDLSLNYQFEYGLEFLPKLPESMGAVRFMEVTNELRYNDNPTGGKNQTYSQDLIENYIQYNRENPDKYPITNWKDEIFNSSAPRQSHVLSIAGGSKNVKTNASLAYDRTDALWDVQYYERFMLRVNNDFKINKYLGAKIDFNFKRSKNHQPQLDFEAVNQNALFTHALQMPSIYAARWSDGRYGEGRDGGNIVSFLHEAGTQDTWSNQVGGRVSLDLKPFDGLVVSGIVSPTYNFNKIKSFHKAVPYTKLEDPNTIVGYRGSNKTTKLTEKRNDNYNVTIQFLANYDKQLGRHGINAMIGYESYYAFFENLMASRDQYELGNYPYLNLGPLSMRDNSGNASEVAYRSYFGRIMYNYDNRYLFQVNFRRDGSSRFHKDYRWSNFPSFSAGWVLSEESFMKNLQIDWLSNLKLRASWGTLGNERILDSNGNPNYYPYQAAMSFGNVLFFQNGKPLSYLSAAQLNYALKNISWETTESFDLGLDAGFLNNRLRFTFDFYKKKTKDMLLALEIPGYVGFGNPQKNTGTMNTTGYDADLSWNDQKGDWRYGISVNLSDFVSKMGNLGGTEFLGEKVKMEGSEFNEWYGYLSDGLILTEEDLNGPKLNNNIKIGDIKYKDISGPDGVPDGKISPEYDRVLLGGSLPRFMFGGTANIGYKGFDFSMAFQGVGKQNVRYSQMMVRPLTGEWANAPSLIEGKYWSSYNTDVENAKAVYPRISNVNASANYAMSDFWMFNGRYLRLKNLTLGYTLPQNVTNVLFIDRIRVYVSANDLFQISNYPKGWDPEMSGTGYPVTKSCLFGLSVKF